MSNWLDTLDSDAGDIRAAGGRTAAAVFPRRDRDIRGLRAGHLAA